MVGQIATRAVPAPIQVGRRWVIERTHAWGNQDGKLRWCTERHGWSSTSGWRWSAPLWSAAGWSAAPEPAAAGTAAHDHLLAQPLSRTLGTPAPWTELTAKLTANRANACIPWQHRRTSMSP